MRTVTVHTSQVTELANDEQRFAVFHWLATFNQDGFNHAGLIGFDLVKQLHRFDDTQRIADVDCLANRNKGRSLRRRRVASSRWSRWTIYSKCQGVLQPGVVIGGSDHLSI